MIVVRITGGLGNQLFQYATGRALAIKKCEKLYLDLDYYKASNNHPFLLDKFSFNFEVISGNNIEFINTSYWPLKINRWGQKLLPITYRDIVTNYSNKYFPNLEKINPPIYIEGYWQSEKYFFEYRDLIKNECILSSKNDNINEKLCEKIERTTNAVSIHIRRGDYITNKKAYKKHGVCSHKYYNKAMDIIRNKVSDPKFFIFSNDKKWAKENFNSSDCHVVVENGISEAHKDLILMYNCDHHIIANSTFSWWGAWLNRNPRKLVYAPKNWYKGQEEFNPEGLIPDSWNLL